MKNSQVTYYIQGHGLQFRNFDTPAEAISFMELNLCDNPDVVFRELRVIQA